MSKRTQQYPKHEALVKAVKALTTKVEEMVDKVESTACAAVDEAWEASAKSIVAELDGDGDDSRATVYLWAGREDTLDFHDASFTIRDLASALIKRHAKDGYQEYTDGTVLDEIADDFERQAARLRRASRKEMKEAAKSNLLTP